MQQEQRCSQQQQHHPRPLGSPLLPSPSPQAKYASYHERMHRHRTNDSDAQDDPALWVGRSPRKVR